ncbi:MAG: hypothetical protein R3A79_11140 [Nannocystaceae bacterium]
MSWISRVLIGVVVVLLLVIGALAWLFRSQAEAIPDELPTLDASKTAPADIMIPGGDIPDLKVAELKGKRAYFVLEDRESMQAGESKDLNRALARWELGDDVVGYAIGDAQGFGVFRSKIDEFMGMMRPEMRLPLYIDYEGVFYDAFMLPRGHTGFVLLGPDSEVVHRHSGPADADAIEAIRGHLDGREPEPPPAPDFAVAEVNGASCEGRVCLFAFLDAPVERAAIPGIEGGFDGGREESFKRFAEPSVRLVGVIAGADEKIDEDKHTAVIVGDVKGFEFRRVKTVDAAPEARAAFGLGDGAGLVVVDHGRLAFKAEGKVAFWQLGLVADILGVDLGERDHGEP